MTQRRTQASSQMNSSQIAERFGRYVSSKSNEYGTESPEMSKKADEVVQYILFCSLAEHKATVKRIDINKNILKDSSRQYKDIMTMAKRRLNDVFGINLVIIDGNDKGEKYGIKCKYELDPSLSRPDFLNNKSSESNETTPELMEKFKYSLLMVSLAIIFMNENEIDSNLFWELLKKIDINKDEKKHKYLGDVFKFFTYELVKEGFLEYTQIPGYDIPQFKFKSGYRSDLEITKKSILDFVCSVHGGIDVCKPEEWSVQYAEACKADKAEESAMEVEDNEDDSIEEEAPTQTRRGRNVDRSEIYSQQATQQTQRSQRRR